MPDLEPQRLYLLYHVLRPEKSDYSYALETHQFARHLELLASLRTPSFPIWPEITFDDGHVSNYEHALPLLAAHETKATFFITSGWTGTRADYMDWTQLRALHAAGHTIGAHGWSHALLTHCNDAELDKELHSARHLLEDKLGAPITTMSFPGGRHNARILAACHAAGYTQLFTSEPKAQIPGPLNGRFNIRGSMTAPALQDLFDPHSSTLNNLGRQYRIKAAAKSILGDRLYASLWALLNRKEPGTDAGDPA